MSKIYAKCLSYHCEWEGLKKQHYMCYRIFCMAEIYLETCCYSLLSLVSPDYDLKCNKYQ